MAKAAPKFDKAAYTKRLAAAKARTKAMLAPADVEVAGFWRGSCKVHSFPRRTER